MKRREFMNQGACLGIAVVAASVPHSVTHVLSKVEGAFATDTRLTPPAKGKIPVAFAIGRRHRHRLRRAMGSLSGRHG
jgi:hypothetical protein